MEQERATGRPHLGTLVDTMDAWGHAPAIVDHRGVRRFVTTYRELAAYARDFAAELESRQIAEGDRVVLWGRNSAAWIGAYFGCVLRGVLPVPLDATGSQAFARRVVEEVAPRLLVGDGDLLADAPPGRPSLVLDAPGERSSRGRRPSRVALTPQTSLQILFTSGSTGVPKGIVHTHGNLLASLSPIEREIERYRRYERIVHPLRILHTLPLSHVFGQFMGLWVPPILGAVVHYEDRVTGSRMAESIANDHIHVLAAVPRTLDLLRASLVASDPALPQHVIAAQGLPVLKRWWRFRGLHRRLGLRFWAAVCGGATLDPATEQFWTTLGFALIQGYGLTETAALVTLNHPFRIARGSLGAPLPGRELRLSPTGELEVKGAMISTATWQGGGVVRREDPWLATGDLASIGEDGRVRFLGRSGQRLVTAAGLNVYLQDVEAVLLAQSGIREAVVFPIAAAAGGEEPGAVLVAPDGEAAAAEGVARANAALAPHQQVRQWRLWPGLALPRTASGKLARKRVQDWLATETASFAGSERQETGDPLVALLLSVGASAGPLADRARLDEDWGLDSMGRVALAAALEERIGVALPNQSPAELRTLGDLRRLLRGATTPHPHPDPDLDEAVTAGLPAAASQQAHVPHSSVPAAGIVPKTPGKMPFSYPRWPFHWFTTAVRAVFTEGVLRPLVWLLASPRARTVAPVRGPVLLVANHRTAVDVPLLLYALPGAVRRRMAVAMSGEMLAGWRYSWSLHPVPPSLAVHRRWWGPPAAFAVRALFNVFPLPASAGFRESFEHAGHALDRGFSVMIFPEGQRSHTQQMLSFKPGVGILAQESHVEVVPAALHIVRQTHWRGSCQVVIGRAILLEPGASPQRIAAELEAQVRALLT